MQRSHNIIICSHEGIFFLNQLLFSINSLFRKLNGYFNDTHDLISINISTKVLFIHSASITVIVVSLMGSNSGETALPLLGVYPASPCTDPGSEGGMAACVERRRELLICCSFSSLKSHLNTNNCIL